MRILVISPEQLPVPPLLGGSVETCINETFRRIARSDRVTIVSRRYGSLPSNTKARRGSIEHIRVKGAGHSATYLRNALRQVRGRAFDVIQVENRPSFVPAIRNLFPHTPLILSLHSLTFMAKLSRLKAKRVLGAVDGVVTVASFLTASMKRTYPAYAHLFQTVSPGIETGRFRPRSSSYRKQMRQRWKVVKGCNLLFVGRIVPKKGLHTLVRAASIVKRRVPGVRVVAAGASWPGIRAATPYMRSVVSLARRLGVQLRMTGYIAPRRVHQIYQLGDVFVCPTQYREGIALVNGEAMASGIPVIASSRGGIPQVIRHGVTGTLVNAYRSPNAFANAILRVRSNPQASRNMVKAARRFIVKHYSWGTAARKLQALYRRRTK